MADLTLHGRPIATVFNLLGANEDDITYSLGWALSQSERLARAVLAEVFDAPAGEIGLDPLPVHTSGRVFV